MIETVSRVAALLLLVVVMGLAVGRIVWGERHVEAGGSVPGPRPRRLRLVDGWLGASLILLCAALGIYLAAGIQ